MFPVLQTWKLRPRKAEGPELKQLCELLSSMLDSLAVIRWCGPTGSKMEWGSARWVLVLQLPSLWETESFI